MNPRRNGNHGYPNSEAVEREDLFPRIALLVRTRGIPGRHDVVVRAPVLIVGDQQQGLSPFGRFADCLPDFPKELLPGDDVVGWVLIIGVLNEAGLQERILGQSAPGTVRLEVVKVAESYRMRTATVAATLAM